MAELPLNIKKSIGKFEPIEAEGLILYPVLVENYYEFLAAKASLEFMQQRLPVELMSEPLLSAYFKLDTHQVEGVEPTGIFMAALLMLSLALRLKPEGSIEEQVRQFNVLVDPNDTSRLKGLRFLYNGEEQATITPIQFQKIRPIIAAQNGIELPDESANPEIVDAENDLAESKAPKLDINIPALVSAGALVSGADETEVYKWAILKLSNRLESAKRVLDYMICGIGESQGTKWKGGNPHPHPWFNRQKDGNAGLMPIESFANGQGLGAVQNANNNSSMELGNELQRDFTNNM